MTNVEAATSRALDSCERRRMLGWLALVLNRLAWLDRFVDDRGRPLNYVLNADPELAAYVAHVSGRAPSNVRRARMLTTNIEEMEAQEARLNARNRAERRAATRRAHRRGRARR
jgi:hypothetical protein